MSTSIIRANMTNRLQKVSLTLWRPLALAVSFFPLSLSHCYLFWRFNILTYPFREMFLIHCKRGLRIDDVKWIALQLTKMKISFPEVSTLKYRKSLNVSIYYTVWREACTKSKVSWLTTQHNDAGQFKNQDSLFLTDNGASHQTSFKPGLVGSICLVWWLDSGGRYFA